MSDRNYTPVRDEALAKIAKAGICFANESRDMARELIERRAADAKAKVGETTVGYHPYGNIFGGGGP
ncbi:MAG: hypothetical protein ACREXP_03400 [Steroidobacteraceae bacterium]